MGTGTDTRPAESVVAVTWFTDYRYCQEIKRPDEDALFQYPMPLSFQ